MIDCFIVFYDCEADGRICSCRLFSDIELVRHDEDLFYESFPKGLTLVIPISVSDESIGKALESYFENINEQL